MLDGHRLPNRASHRRTDDMRLLEAEYVQQPGRVGSHMIPALGGVKSVTGRRVYGGGWTNGAPATRVQSVPATVPLM